MSGPAAYPNPEELPMMQNLKNYLEARKDRKQVREVARLMPQILRNLSGQCEFTTDISENPDFIVAVGQQLDHQDIAYHLDSDDIASHISESDIAYCIDTGDLASEFCTTEIGLLISEDLDLQEIADRVDIEDHVNDAVSNYGFEDKIPAAVDEAVASAVSDLLDDIVGRVIDEVVSRLGVDA